MRTAIRSAAELRRLLDLPPPDDATALAEASFPTFVTREFLSRIEHRNAADPLLRQVLPIGDETIRLPGFQVDPVGDVDASIVPGLLQKYARRVLVVATGACGIHCRYCFRREYDYSTSARQWRSMIGELTNRPEIDEVILSGGDPLTLVDSQLDELLAAIESLPHVRRLRFHSRMPIVVPSRINDAFILRMRSSRLAVWMVIHCNHANEIDAEVEASLARMVDAGIPVLNQAVLLRGVNDDVDTMETLCRRLVDLRVAPYYLHQLDRVIGAAHFEADREVGLLMIEELRRRLPGYAVPHYVIENAGESSKTPIVGS